MQSNKRSYSQSVYLRIILVSVIASLSFNSTLHAQVFIDTIQEEFGKNNLSNIDSVLDIDSVQVAVGEDSTTKQSIIKKKRHSPLKAALFSAALPGLGQGYNKKYWKIPIVYAGFGGLGYALYYTRSNFIGYRNAYRLEVDKNPATIGSYKGVATAEGLKVYRDYFKRNLDITAICTAVWYTLNIVDAAVDAHLFEWNMRDDIDLSWQPSIISPNATGGYTTVGLSLCMKF